MTEIEWERPGDELLTWERDEVHTPRALTPLTQGMMCYVAQGITRASAERGSHMTMRIRVHAGHTYWAMVPGEGALPKEEQERLRVGSQEALATRWEREWLPEIQANLDRHRVADLAGLSNAELACVLQDALVMQARHWHIHFNVVSDAHGAVNRFVSWYQKRFPGAPESEPYKLLQGVANTSVRSGHRLWRLSRMVTPEIAAALRQGERTDLPDPFRQEFEAYLEEFGRRPHVLLDIGSPTWLEDPAPVVRVILGYVSGDAEDPLAEGEWLAAERELFTAEVRERLVPDEQPAFDALLALARSVSPLTEDHAYWIDQQTVAALRRICVEFARRLTACSALESAADMDFVTLEEMVAWGMGGSQLGLRRLVAERRLTHETNLAGNPPLILGAPPAPPAAGQTSVEPAEATPAAPEELRGIGASAGVARGRARVVRSLGEAGELQLGEVLVCFATDPNWTPLFGMAAALVTETGGSLSHAAVVAREYRLPAVVGARKVTATIQTGQEVEVDGTRGIIRLL